MSDFEMLSIVLMILSIVVTVLIAYINQSKKVTAPRSDMLPSYRTMKYKSPIWGYFHVQKE